MTLALSISISARFPLYNDVTDRLLKQIEDSAGELGRPVLYLPSAKDRKEDIAKGFLLSDPVDEGLICILKTLESCRSAKVVGRDGKHFLRSSYTKCLHYYLYYLDRDFGFMFVKIQTWFPFNIQVYINGRELMKHIFDANGISYPAPISSPLGRKLDPRFQAEAVSDYKKHPIRCRVKFELKSNSVKMYDKCCVLRIETTINDPRGSQ